MKEQKESLKQRIKLFFKKNCYAIVVASSALILAVALAITAFVGSDISRKEKEHQQSPQTNQTETKGEIQEDAKPSSTAPIVFTYPVKDYTLGSTFTDSTLVYNETLNEYTTHLGVDFIVSDGAEVMASSDGEIEAINYDSLTGTSIVINHGNGLKTSYQSLASDVAVEVGQKVSSGEVIGKASNSAGGEQNLGAHVHFSAILNGSEVNPMNYLGEK